MWKAAVLRVVAGALLETVFGDAFRDAFREAVPLSPSKLDEYTTIELL
jgi:hypothetical protein